MLENTYDATGIKFGFIPNTWEHYDKETFMNKLNIMLQSGPSSYLPIIDYKHIDGLTLEEFKDLVGSKIIFVSYVSINNQDKVIKNKNVYQIIVMFVTDDNKNESIDEAIEKQMKKNYKQYGKKGKRCTRCFLARYRYEKKSKVDEILEQYQKKKTKRK